ncbi:hypothetical protein PENTCL1PPCAC_17815 [Pristionchus entomophagus]|uniref:Uncharacterized protein n=1 Tax=Pristionchus entomophagus TaxID=358040 RepID=A0AAV5TMY7_9BILA|nr:hypothetical protein PENTCL1PPCAC_17815 [Pristionchus entomophagus]
MVQNSYRSILTHSCPNLISSGSLLFRENKSRISLLSHINSRRGCYLRPESSLFLLSDRYSSSSMSLYDWITRDDGSIIWNFLRMSINIKKRPVFISGCMDHYCSIQCSSLSRLFPLSTPGCSPSSISIQTSFLYQIFHHWSHLYLSHSHCSSILALPSLLLSNLFHLTE